jgi:hypothetical protein
MEARSPACLAPHGPVNGYVGQHADILFEGKSCGGMVLYFAAVAQHPNQALG